LVPTERYTNPASWCPKSVAIMHRCFKKKLVCLRIFYTGDKKKNKNYHNILKIDVQWVQIPLKKHGISTQRAQEILFDFWNLEHVQCILFFKYFTLQKCSKFWYCVGSLQINGTELEDVAHRLYPHLLTSTSFAIFKQ
jgi:hypothetical protein